MSLVVGLDIGTRTVAGAVMSGTAKKFRLEDFFVAEIPRLEAPRSAGALSNETVDLEAGVPPSLAEVIKKLIADHGLQGADVVASIDAKDCVIREMQVPFTSDAQIQKMVTFEAENYLTTFDIEDMVLEYHKVGEVDEKSQLVLVAVRNQVVADRLELLRDGGIDPVALDLDAAALFNAFALTPTFTLNPDRTTLLIDVGATTTKVLLIEQGTLKKIRSLRLGAYFGAYNPRQIAEPVGAGARAAGGKAGEFQLPEASSIEARFDEIENALRRLDPLRGDPAGQAPKLEDDEPIAILSDEEFERIAGAEAGAAAEEADAGADDKAVAAPYPAPASAQSEAGAAYSYGDFLDRLSLEIQRTFASKFIESPIELICLTGGMSQREEAKRYFSENFDVETIALDFEDSFPTSLPEDRRDALNQLGAVAVGLAAKELGKDRIAFDFRKNQFRYERRFEKLKYPLLSTAVLLSALFLTVGFHLLREYRALDFHIQRIHSRAATYYQAFFDENPSGASLADAAQGKMRQWNNLLGEGGGDIPIYIEDIETITDLSRVFQEAWNNRRISFEIESMDLRLRTRTSTQARKGGPALQAESESRIVLNTLDPTAERALSDIFRTQSRQWQASPAQTKRGEKFVITLNLTPKESYLRMLRP